MMTLSVDENEKLIELLDALKPSLSDMKPHEKRFVEDQLARHDTYGAEIFMSPKQMGWLRALRDRFAGDEAPEDRGDDSGPDDIPFAPR